MVNLNNENNFKKIYKISSNTRISVHIRYTITFIFYSYKLLLFQFQVIINKRNYIKKYKILNFKHNIEMYEYYV